MRLIFLFSFSLIFFLFYFNGNKPRSDYAFQMISKKIVLEWRTVRDHLLISIWKYQKIIEGKR